MKKMVHKNQVVITTLAFLIAIAGYISYDRSSSKEDPVAATSIETDNSPVEDYDIALADSTTESVETMGTEVEEILNPGEAVLTSTIVSGSDYASEIKLNREQVRSKNKETLLEIINNESMTEEQKKDAVEQMVALTDIAEKEAEAEALLEAKGFTNVVVSIDDETCDVVLDMGEVTDAKCAQVEDIVKRKTDISADKIVITPINTQSETTIESVD